MDTFHKSLDKLKTRPKICTPFVLRRGLWRYRNGKLFDPILTSLEMWQSHINPSAKEITLQNKYDVSKSSMWIRL